MLCDTWQLSFSWCEIAGLCAYIVNVLEALSQSLNLEPKGSQRPNFPNLVLPLGRLVGRCRKSLLNFKSSLFDTALPYLV